MKPRRSVAKQSGEQDEVGLRERKLSESQKTPKDARQKIRTNSSSEQKSPKPNRQAAESPKVSKRRTMSFTDQDGQENPAERKRTISSSRDNSGSRSGTSPRGERKRSSDSKSEKTGRRRSMSSSEAKDKKEKQQHSYRMHRIKFFDYEPQAINCITCDERNHKIALSRSDGSIEIWTFGEGTTDLYQQTIIRTESGTSIEALLWHDGVLLQAGLDGDLIEYDMSTLRPKACIPCHAGAIWCMSISRCNTMIAAGTEEGCVVIYDYTGEGFRYMKSLQKQEERMLSISWHDSSSTLVTGGIDNIRLWSLESGNALQRITIARQSADKPTIVWAVSILKDMTIVSGDSRGKVTFWNGRQGTQLKMFGCHRADILSLTVSPDETQVFAAGIDPTLVQFELAPVSAGSDWLVWQRSGVRAHHTHDVRAVDMMNDYVITGGVDCSLVAANFETKSKFKTIPLPQHKLIHVAKQAKMLLLQYTDHIQLWTLGTTNTEHNNKEEGSDMLPLTSSPVNLLELHTRNEEHIVCSGISSDGQWIAYCDRNTLRLFNLNLGLSELLAPKISASRLKGLPTSISQLPIRCIKFTSDSRLVLGYVNGTVKVLQLKVINSLPMIQNIMSSSSSKDVELGVIHQLEVSPDGCRIAISDTKHNTIVYSLYNDEIKVLCRLPRSDTLVTAMTFSSDSDRLALAYSYSADKIMEYNLVKRRYSGSDNTPQTEATSSRQSVLTTVAKTLNLQYARHDTSLILVHDPLGVQVYDTKTSTLSKDRNMYNNRYLMHFEEMDADFALVVERSPLSLNTALPQALSKKQFGT